MVTQHQHDRNQLNKKHKHRQQKEIKKRQARYSKGFRGLWDRLREKRAELQKQNERESYKSHLRDRAEKDTLISAQLNEPGQLLCVINQSVSLFSTAHWARQMKFWQIAVRQFDLNAEQWEAFQTALDAKPRTLPRIEKLMQEQGFFD